MASSGSSTGVGKASRRRRTYSRFSPGLLLIAAAVLVALTLHESQAHNAKQHVLSRYAVIIVLDGARPDYLHLVPMPNLDKLIRNGIVYRNAFAGQEIANTPPGHATIGTGDYPKLTGVQGFPGRIPSITLSSIRPRDPKSTVASSIA